MLCLAWMLDILWIELSVNQGEAYQWCVNIFIPLENHRQVETPRIMERFDAVYPFCILVKDYEGEAGIQQVL